MVVFNSTHAPRSLVSILFLLTLISSHPLLIPGHSPRHLKEISELQANQRDEIELLYQRLGKAPPLGLGLSHTAPPTGRRKRPSKHKLKAGKLLSPLVQQFRNAKSKSNDASKTSE